MSVTTEMKHLSEAEKQSLEVAEGARETEWTQPSFVKELFLGRFRTDLITPYPLQSAEDKAIGDKFCDELETFLKENLDPDEVDKSGLLPQKVIDDLAKLGCWGMKITTYYGGM